MVTVYTLYWRYRPLSRRLDRCDRVIQNESRYPFGGYVYYVTMQITFFTRKFRNVERNLHCDVVQITTKWVSSLTLDCNVVFAIKAYAARATIVQSQPSSLFYQIDYLSTSRWFFFLTFHICHPPAFPIVMHVYSF